MIRYARKSKSISNAKSYDYGTSENSEEYKGLVVNKGIEQPSSVNPLLKAET